MLPREQIKHGLTPLKLLAGAIKYDAVPKLQAQRLLEESEFAIGYPIAAIGYPRAAIGYPRADMGYLGYPP